MPVQLAEKVLSWAPDVDETLAQQVTRLGAMPFIHRIALMPDAHVGIGSSIGTVFGSRFAIAPAAVGVDIGCGMLARRYPFHANRIPDLDDLRLRIMQAVPTGLGAAHPITSEWRLMRYPHHDNANHAFSGKQVVTAQTQFGSLGGGNHFVEVCEDEDAFLWVVIHSGSRGIGNQLARKHIEIARERMRTWMVDQFSEALRADPDLAFLPFGTFEAERYLADMTWAQEYARGNRLAMLDAVENVLSDILSIPAPSLQDVSHPEWVPLTVHCHHNYAVQEHHDGQNLWITRKGAILAREGEMGVIPGSMATGSFITRGLGNAASLNSSSHGAGRRLSRSKARKQFDAASLDEAMAGVPSWNREFAADIVDEHPGAYKDLNDVMDAQADLTEVIFHLMPLVNVKGKS